VKTDEAILPTVVLGVLLMVYGLIEVAFEPKPVTPAKPPPTNSPPTYAASNVVGYIDMPADEWMAERNKVPKGPPGTNERVWEIHLGPRYEHPHYEAPEPSEIVAKTRSGHQYVLVHSTNCLCLKPERE